MGSPVSYDSSSLEPRDLITADNTAELSDWVDWSREEDSRSRSWLKFLTNCKLARFLQASTPSQLLDKYYTDVEEGNSMELYVL